MKNLYLWFYCLPIRDAISFVLLATVVLLYLHRRLGGKAGWRPALGGVLALWLAVILWATLGDRAPDPSGQRISLLPFASYLAVLRGGNPELLRANFMNMVLFYPAGLLLALLLPGRWKLRRRIMLTAAVYCGLSICVEIAQYWLGWGLAETDDVIHNTLGGGIGVVASQIPIQLRSNHP